MPNRWDAEAIGLVGCTCYWAREWGGVHALTCALVKVAELARRAYREGLERAEHLAQMSPDSTGVVQYLAAAIRREIEGA